MSLPKRYNPNLFEPKLAEKWRQDGVYHFDRTSERPLYSIDTPPPTVSGNLHLGHAYSYSHTDFIARFWRMRGYNVFYPMGFDDNGLPTERLVERREGVRAEDVGRDAFIERCLAIGAEVQESYRALFSRLGLSVDWHYGYRSIDREPRRLAQWSFLDLYRRGLAYRREAPAIWCPLCHTALAQADVDDLQRETTFYTLEFELDDGESLPIATTRPELLPACVAIFIHPDDPRAGSLVGRKATTPLFEQAVPVLADPGADPEKGTGIVMCCTFGDMADVEWWFKHELPVRQAIGPDGAMLESTGQYAGLSIGEARRQIVTELQSAGKLLGQEATSQTVRVHERCDTPVEFIVSRQWFVSLLPERNSLLAAGEEIDWVPAHMQARYEQWVENLGWDWCISRQRAFGVPFPVWYCDNCDELMLASEDALPVDPVETPPDAPCPHCGEEAFTPETDVMDTWATSSLTPQIAGHMFEDPVLYEMVYPFSLRPQAHDIIRTWAFYTIVKSQFHFQSKPWQTITLSGWGLAPQGAGKISKSRDDGPLDFMETMERYSADAVRYWAASTGFGKDSVIDERKISAGSKLATKLWNVARFSERFLEGAADAASAPPLTPADRWIQSRCQRLIERVTTLMESYDYATAKSEIETFFWTEFADNYLEMAKKRLYDGGDAARGAQVTLRMALLTTLKLLAPFMPYITETIYQSLFEEEGTIHRDSWPEARRALFDEEAEALGIELVTIAGAVRRYKSEENMSLAAELAQLHLLVADEETQSRFRAAEADLVSVTRARKVIVSRESNGNAFVLEQTESARISVNP